MGRTLRLNPKNVEGFIQKLSQFSFSLENTKDPLKLAKKEADPYIRRVFGRMNAAFRERLASTAMRPDLMSFFVHPRATANTGAATYETGELYNSLRYETEYRTRGQRRTAMLRVFSKSTHFNIAEDPTMRNRITLPRVREWLQQKFGISQSTPPNQKVTFNPRAGHSHPVRYDQLVFSIYGAIVQGQMLKRYRSLRLRQVLAGEVQSSRGNAEVTVIKDRIASQLFPVGPFQSI